MPTISVIVPAYNAEKTILETIQSIQAQTFTDFELIVINDGSTDGTLDKLATISDPRLKVFSYPNGGLPVARNRGIEQSIGEFLSFIDADDLWQPDKLERQLRTLQANPEAGVAYSWTRLIDENGISFHDCEPLAYRGNVYSHLLICNFIANGSNILVRRKSIEAAGQFDPHLKSVEDWDYYLRLASLCSFEVVTDYQILYRRSSQSMTSKIDVMESANLIVIERAFKQAPQNLQYLKSQSLASMYRYLAKQCLFNQLDRTGVRLANQKLKKAIMLYPKIVLSRETQRLIVKLLTIQLLPQNMANQIIKLLGKQFPMVPVSK